MQGRMGMALAASLWLASTLAAGAEEVTLKGITSFAEKTFYSRGFERFIDKVNADGKGLVQISYIGGPKAMPPFEVGNALKSGVVDLANVTGAFYTNVMPEADAWKLTQKPMAELRKDGGYAYMANLYEQKMNAILLARHIDNNPFHLYLTKPISGPDLTGLKLRITPVYRDFFQALGATVVQTAPGEVYTALERGVIDGTGFPNIGLTEQGWEKLLKYRIYPTFWQGDISLIVNADSWKRLDAKARDLLQKSAIKAEKSAHEFFHNEVRKEDAKLKAAGMKDIRLPPEDAKKYEAAAHGALWDQLGTRLSKQEVDTLRKTFYKE